VTGDGSVHTRVEGLLLACIAAVGVDGGGMSLVSATGTRQPAPWGPDRGHGLAPGRDGTYRPGTRPC
jgi:hypothetical protein